MWLSSPMAVVIVQFVAGRRGRRGPVFGPACRGPDGVGADYSRRDTGRAQPASPRWCRTSPATVDADVLVEQSSMEALDDAVGLGPLHFAGAMRDVLKLHDSS